VMQRVVSKIMSSSDSCDPVSLIVDKVETQFVVPAPCVYPPCTKDPALSHERDCKGGLTPQRIVSTNREGGNFAPRL